MTVAELIDALRGYDQHRNIPGHSAELLISLCGSGKSRKSTCKCEIVPHMTNAQKADSIRDAITIIMLAACSTPSASPEQWFLYRVKERLRSQALEAQQAVELEAMEAYLLAEAAREEFRKSIPPSRFKDDMSALRSGFPLEILG